MAVAVIAMPSFVLVIVVPAVALVIGVPIAASDRRARHRRAMLLPYKLVLNPCQIIVVLYTDTGLFSTVHCGKIPISRHPLIKLKPCGEPTKSACPFLGKCFKLPDFSFPTLHFRLSLLLPLRSTVPRTNFDF